ncbi:MAG: microcyclamide/patellamide family RiPP [Oscillatoria sp. SIO1A7]|nr:microcyclamide/patellamide family RiPP [Oscillatoria sp. SIO1A7]
MNKKNISPNPQQPVDRVPAGQLPSALAELSEEALASASVLPAFDEEAQEVGFCSFDGD